MLEMGRKIIHAGRSVGLTECDVEDARGHLIARASSTCMTLRDERARGR
jgi:acyl-coenzyme A thioesterase PaaI-like protein